MMSSRPYRLLHVFPSFQIGGPQIRFVELARLAGSEFHHLVISRDGQIQTASLVADCDNVEVIPCTGANTPWARFRAALKDLSLIEVDLLVTYNWGAMEWAAAGRLTGIPQLHIADGFGKEEARARLMRRSLARRFVLRGKTEVVVPSSTLFAIARREWGVPETRLSRIANGIDLAIYPAARDRQQVANLGIDRSAAVIGWIGALRREKNVERLLQAMTRVGVAAHLLLIGDGPEREPLRALVDHLGIADKVSFLGERTDIPHLLAACDLLALSSDTEQMPLAVLEAMASGLPVASVDVGDVRHMVSVENAPYIVPLSDAALAEAITSLANDPEGRLRIGQRNREVIRQSYRRDDMVSAYRRLFFKALARSGGSQTVSHGVERRQVDDLNLKGLS
jgi:glycosyltransferase involved in cell wall biosynthesis